MILIVAAIIFGGLVIYFLNFFRTTVKNTEPEKHVSVQSEEVASSKEEDRSTAQTEVRGSKRTKNKKRREIHQEFSHPWLVGTLKGHTAPVLDMSFSANGKYLASCAEADQPRAEKAPKYGSRVNRKNQGGHQERQKKPGGNQRRNQSTKEKKKISTPSKPIEMSSASKKLSSSVYRDALGYMKGGQLFENLKRYVLSKDDLVSMGYPMQIEGLPKCARIKAPHPNAFRPNWKNSNAGENDSGKGSSVENSEDESDIAEESKMLMTKLETFSQRTCTRCKVVYCTSNEESCTYHWGKVRSGIWQCCSRLPNSLGCTTAPSHVCSGIVPGYNVIPDFVVTKPAPVRPADGDYGIYALDCEMCFTKQGMQIAKVSVVNTHGSVIYDTFVVPEEPVIDYNTRFSGIVPENLKKAKKSLKKVQEDLHQFIFAETILIGHGLENDLRVLKIIHNTVIDTAKIYPHTFGLPMRNSLKILAQSVLNIKMHTGVHDSVQDARVASDLTLKKLCDDLKTKAQRTRVLQPAHQVINYYPVLRRSHTIVYLPTTSRSLLVQFG